MAKLNLNTKKIEYARQLAKTIVKPILNYIKSHTTTSIERTVLRLFSVDGVNDLDVPLSNVIIDKLPKEKLKKGITYYFIKNLKKFDNLDNFLNFIKEGGKIDTELKEEEIPQLKEIAYKEIKKGFFILDKQKSKRNELLQLYPYGRQPWLYLIVATGNIYEDVKQAQAAAMQGADIIAVIRTTAQSLLDYVPYGATTQGFGGTYATQENFKIMRKALDEIIEKEKRYIQLVNYSSGLCMAEIALLGALERLDMLLNDAMYGILFRDINMYRTFTDQYFSRLIIAYSDIIINTGEDNYLTTADAFKQGHTVVASDLINEAFGLAAGLKDKQLGLGHAFEMDPEIENGFLYEIAQAQLIREIFPNSPIKYMPPTKYMTGNIFKGHIQDAMFNFASMFTKQSIHLLGMMTEALHTPHIHDRYLSIENAKYVMTNTRNLSDDLEFKKDGIIVKRANFVLDETIKLLEQISEIGLIKAIGKGIFADIKRQPDGGKGLDGVIKKDKDYFNPLEEIIKSKLNIN